MDVRSTVRVTPRERLRIRMRRTYATTVLYPRLPTVAFCAERRYATCYDAMKRYMANPRCEMLRTEGALCTVE